MDKHLLFVQLLASIGVRNVIVVQRLLHKTFYGTGL